MLVNCKKTYFARLSISGAKILGFKILKKITYNTLGFTFVIIIWGSIFIVLRQPWKFLIKKKHGLVYCSIYLFIYSF